MATLPSCQQGYPPAWTVNDLLAALCDELAEGDVPAPLAQPLTLAFLWADLARLAGEPVPPDVAAYLDAPAVEAVLVAD